MAWTTPRTWVTSEVVTAAVMNTHVRDNLNETAPAVVASGGSRYVVSTAANTLAERLPSIAIVNTQENTTSTSYTDLTTSGPAVTETTGDRALVVISARLINTSAGGSCLVSYAISGATTVSANDQFSIRSTSSAANEAYQMSYVKLHTGLTPGSNTFTMKYKAASSTARFANRSISILPL